MVAAVKLVLAALMFGENVLLHCRQGKHRSGVFCVLILALLLGSDIDAALEFYFSKWWDLQVSDWRRVNNILESKNYKRLLEMLRRQSWHDKALNNILNTAWAEGVRRKTKPVAKKMPGLA